MTEEELFELWNKMRKERVEARKLPYEPSPMEFAMKVANIAHSRGYCEGHKSGSTGVFGEPLG